MLEAILEKKTCAACRFCCVFDATDIWEMPLVDASVREAALASIPGGQIHPWREDYHWLCDL